MSEFHDLSDDERKAIEKRAQRKQNRDAGDLEKILSLVEGRRLLWRILAEAGIFRQSFNTNGLQMAFNEGARSIGNLLLMEIMRAQPATFAQMQREHNSDIRSERAAETKAEEKKETEEKLS